MLVEVPLKDAIARLDLRRNSEGERFANFLECSRSNQWPDTRPVRGHKLVAPLDQGGDRVCIYRVNQVD